MIGKATRVGKMLADAVACVIHEQPIEYIRCLADRCRDDLGSEGCILIGHMAVSLEAWDVAIFRVDQIHRFALLGSKEELPVAGCGFPLSPEGGHRQSGMGFHDHGERPIIGAAFDMPACDPQQFPEAVRIGRRCHLA